MAKVSAQKKTRPQLGLFDALPPAPAPPVAAAKAPPPPARGETPAPPLRAVAPPPRRATAEALAQKQREISVSEFFVKNRHLLGFDNPSKAVLTTIKEAVDNSLDACEEAGILPELMIEVHDLALEAIKKDPELTKGEGRFLVVVQDNGPGIVKAQVPKIFGKLLYGSKFHHYRQARGQQGIGISAAAMYGQLTTGKPIRVTSRVGKRKAAHVFDIQLDTRKNEPVITHDEELAEWHLEHGTRLELEIVANWQQGQRFVNRYVEHTALANPHATLHYSRPVGVNQRTNASVPGNETLSFPRATTELPKEAVEIKPHPHGVELGALMLMAQESKSHDVRGFLQTAFSRVSAQTAGEIVGKTSWGKKTVRPRVLGANRAMAEELQKAIASTRLMSPPTSCLSPIGDELMRKGLVSFLNVIESEGESGDENAQLDLDAATMKPSKKAAKASAADKKRAAAEAAPAPPSIPDAPPEEGVEKIKGHNYFIATVTRPPKVYRGNPFQIEVGLAYGGSWPADKTIELFRFANRVPLLFQRGACGITDAIVHTDWRNYQLSQPKGSLPVGPMALLVHIASVWVPFTSESKEAVAHYPDIIKEIQLAAQECGRKLATFIRKRKAADYQAQRRSIFELYIEEVAAAIGKITGRKPGPIKREFLQVAHKVTAAEMAEEEKSLMAPRKDAISKKTVAKIEKLADGVLKTVSNGKNPFLDIPIRSLANVKWSDKKRLVELGNQKQKRYFFNVSMAKKFMQTFLVSEACKELIDSGKTTSIRDLYYVTKHTIGDSRQNTFEEQDESDPIIEDLEVTVDALREELHLFAARKGSMVGPVTITDTGDTIDLRRMGSGGWAVPSIVEENVITFRKHEAKYVLLIEKDAVWTRFNEDKFWKRNNCIIVQGGGQPPRGVRRLVQRLHSELKLPVYVLVDNDPWGFYIYSVMKQGSINLAYESMRMAVPDARFVGLSSFDKEKYQLPTNVAIKMDDGDNSRAKQMLAYPWFKQARWQREIQEMVKSGLKFELEALSRRGISFITEEYLPKKLKDRDWLE